MHRLLRRRPRDEQGAVAILVGTLLVALLVLVGLVLDFGLARVDRQVDKSAADSAAMAGAYGLNQGDGAPHAYAGVCSAIRFLKQNDRRFGSLTTTTGWTNGNGVATASGCTDTSLRAKQCKGADKTTWAVWKGSTTYQGVTIYVTIQGGYVLPSASNPSNWPEDNLSASLGDTGVASYAGCDQLAVTVSQTRKPGFGSLATSSDLATAVRSVARVESKPGGAAPAMLLLQQTGCPVVVTGSNGGSSYIHVLGAVTSNNQSQPGTIHSDSDGVGCNGSNNSWVFGGLAPGGVVAYAAPLVGATTSPDPANPGQITSVASANGITGTPVRDSNTNVYGSSLLSGSGGSHTDVTSRGLVTRSLVDQRYFGCGPVSASCAALSGVKGIVATASNVFATGITSTPSGWTPLTAANVCKPTQQEVTDSVNNAAATGGKLYIGCTGPNGFEGSGTTLHIDATQVYFKGIVAPASGLALSLPNATNVYIGNQLGKPNAVLISNGTSFSVNNATANLTSGNCTTGPSTTLTKSVLAIRDGQFKETGGLLRLCRTTTVMMGGKTDGCVPATTGTAPNPSTPCGVGTMGTGQFTQNGGDIDWTAPDTLDVTKDPVTGKSTAAAIAAWLSLDGPEDLALWTESGSNTSSNYSMAGGGLFRVRGVFMTPNAAPFTLSGGAHLDLTNAQFITNSIALNGNTTSVDMRVDPNSAVTLPDQGVVGLVR